MPRDDSRRLPPALKRLGQHFLTDRGVLEKIARAAEIAPGDTVIEVGPGRGALTDVLVPLAHRLVIIEVDHGLVPILRERYASHANVEVVEADVLETDLVALAGGPYRLVGNVPYYITTPIIFHALKAPRPLVGVFLVQREVADRIVAPPGHDAYGALSVNVQALADVQIVAHVPAGAFRPRPKVDSAVFRMVPRAEPAVMPDEEDEFQRFVLAVFGQRRKQMRRVLRTVRAIGAEAADAALMAAAIDPTARPETLAPLDFARLLRALRT